MSEVRGQQKLFADVFLTPPELTVQRQGRSEELIGQRNECLIARYYYHGKFGEKRYDSILSELQSEFFIEEFTIQKRISENYELLLSLKAQQPTRDFFKKKWPHLVWP